MARIDVTDVLLDPDFLDDTLLCERQLQDVNQSGIASNTPDPIPFAGVVMPGSGLVRLPDGEQIKADLIIYTRFKLITGDEGISADIVTHDNKRYTVVNVADFSRYGRGFTEVACVLQKLSG